MSKSRLFIIIASTVIFTIISGYLFDAYKKSYSPDAEYYRITDSLLRDVSDETQSKFPQIASLYDEYRTNKVAFDQLHNDKAVEFEGAISEITNEYQCSELTFDIIEDENTYIGNVRCSNCPAGEDRWAKKVAKLKVGQIVKIKGFYSGDMSNRRSMVFYKCTITK